METNNIFNIFFFSSRRRHTRSLRDWSSDVCSSDLANAAQPLVGTGRRRQKHGRPRASVHAPYVFFRFLDGKICDERAINEIGRASCRERWLSSVNPRPLVEEK